MSAAFGDHRGRLSSTCRDPVRLREESPELNPKHSPWFPVLRSQPLDLPSKLARRVMCHLPLKSGVAHHTLCRRNGSDSIPVTIWCARGLPYESTGKSLWPEVARQGRVAGTRALLTDDFLRRGDMGVTWGLGMRILCHATVSTAAIGKDLARATSVRPIFPTLPGLPLGIHPANAAGCEGYTMETHRIIGLISTCRASDSGTPRPMAQLALPGTIPTSSG